MGYDPNVCLQKLKGKGYIPCDTLSLPYHCDTLTGVGGDYHQDCIDEGVIYFPVRVANCHNNKTNQNRYFSPDKFFDGCGALRQQDPNWVQQWCYCCCACFARDTLIATPDGPAEIYTIPTGATVLAGSVLKTAGGITTSWSNQSVGFSEGTGEGHQPMMVYLGFGDGDPKDLICTPDQPFLLADGKYTTAGKLRPGQQLVDRDGKPVTLHLVSMGSYEGGVHHIATSLPWEGPNGHLLIAGGVIAGDFTFQLKFELLDPSEREDGYDELPTIGTAEYDQAHAPVLQRSNEALFEFVKSGSVGPMTGQRRVGRGLFRTYRTAASDPPFGAQSMLTSKQASDVLMKGTQVPLSNPIAKILFDIISRQLSGFYPDILFYFDPFDVLPNVYAFEAYGKKIVQVSGGLARLEDFNYEGLCMAMAHGVGCFYGGEPRNSMGYSAVGQADLYAFGVIARKLWVGDPAFEYLGAAIAQWTFLFNLVDPRDRHGNPKDPLDDPSLDCRLKTIKSGAFGGGLPECAGGSPKPKIWLEQATATSDTQVSLIFSLGLDPTPANDPANYTFDPPAPITEAKRSDKTDFKVELTAKMQPGTTYRVTASNLISNMGTGMDPAHSTVTFDTPKP